MEFDLIKPEPMPGDYSFIRKNKAVKSSLNLQYKYLPEEVSIEWFRPEGMRDRWKEGLIESRAFMERLQKENDKPPVITVPGPPRHLFQNNTSKMVSAIDQASRFRDRQNRAQRAQLIEEVKQLKEEVKKTKENDLVKNCMSLQPNLPRPSEFNPPIPRQPTTEIAIECVYWFENENGKFPTHRELWRLMKAIAMSEDVQIEGFYLEWEPKTGTLTVEDKPWTSDNCRKFCENNFS